MRAIPYTIRAAACRTKADKALSQEEADYWLQLAQRWEQSAISLAVAGAMTRAGGGAPRMQDPWDESRRAPEEKRSASLGEGPTMTIEAEPDKALETAGRAGSWKWRVDDDVLTGDRRLSEIFGVEPDAVAAGVHVETILSRVHPGDRTALEATIARSIETDGEYEATYRLLVGDEIRWVHANGKCYQSGDGIGRLHVGVVIDISAFRSGEPGVGRRVILDQIAHHCLAVYKLSCEGELDELGAHARDLLRRVGREIAQSMAAPRRP